MKRIIGFSFATMLMTLVMATVWLVTTQSGLRWAYHLALPYLPTNISLEQIEGRLLGPIKFDAIKYEQDGTDIQAKQLIVNYQLFKLLAGRVDVTQLDVQSLRIMLAPGEKSTEPFQLPEISLPWRVTLSDVVINDIQISQKEETIALQQLRLDATSLFNQVDVNDLTIKTPSFTLTVMGKLQPDAYYPHDLSVSWLSKLPSGAIFEGHGQVAGDVKQIRIKQQVSGPIQLELNAQVNNVLEQATWRGDIVVDALDVGTLMPGWPAITGKSHINAEGDLTTARLSGTLNGYYPDFGLFSAEMNLQRQKDNTFSIDRLTLYSPVSETRINVSGQWKPDNEGGDIALALDWKNLHWPLHNPENTSSKTETSWFDSAIGSGWIKGNFNHFQIGLATDRPWFQAPQSDWYASAEGNLDGLNFHSLRVNTLDGETIASGQLNWSPELNWKLQIQANNINPARLPEIGQQWPGRLKANLNTSGHYVDGALVVDADVAQLKGKLRGYPFSLSSQLRWQKDNLDIERLDIKSGHSILRAHGKLGNNLSLNWDIVAKDMAEVYPRASGQFQARGTLGGTRHTPIIESVFNARALSLPDYEIGSIDGSVAVDLFSWQNVDIKLAAQSLRLKSYHLESAKLVADTDHIKLDLTSDTVSAVVELRGKADAKSWRGQIQRAEIRSKRFSDWQLDKPIALDLHEKGLDFDSLCWYSSANARLCASLHKEEYAWMASFDAARIPLMLLGPWLPPDLHLDGVTNASSELRYTPQSLFHSDLPKQATSFDHEATTAKLRGRINLDIPAGQLSYPVLEGEIHTRKYRSGKGEIVLGDTGVKTMAEIVFINDDLLSAHLDLPGAELVNLDSELQPLKANVQITIRELGLIELFVPDVQDVHGEVNVNFSANGTLADPQLNGRARLTNGSLRVPRLGLNIKKFTLTGETSELETLKFQLDAQSGDGGLIVMGQTALTTGEDWNTHISIKGDQFEVSRIPDARVVVSPDLDIELQKYAIGIRGSVHIPFAKLQPKDITMATHVSEDAVIIGGEKTPEKKWSIVSNVRLTLGDRVSLFGFGFDGRLGGSLLLEEEPGQLTRATGEITIPEGRYRAYGQRLDVEFGRLLYAGGPIGNPGLDLRAVRHVGTITTGLKVRGSLNQPQIELFSLPAMSQTDALAYLLLGRPIENASGDEGEMMAKAALALGLSGGDRIARLLGDRFGLDEMRIESSDTGEQTSLVIGRYLSPKLYVSYGVGLIEAVNTFSVRYQISDKWQLKGESGEFKGADLFYTIER